MNVVWATAEVDGRQGKNYEWEGKMPPRQPAGLP